MKGRTGLVVMLVWSGWSLASVSADNASRLLSFDEVLWNRYALTVSQGYVDNPATLNASHGWRSIALGSRGELDLDFTAFRKPTMDIGLGFSCLRGRGTVGREAGAVNENNTLSVSATQWSIQARTRFYRSRRTFPFDPWWGGGVAAGVLAVSEQERAATPGGVVVRPAREAAYSFLGARVMAGLDIRPVREASLLLRLQARYDLNAFTGNFKGHTNGYAVHLGLQWSFWPVAF